MVYCLYFQKSYLSRKGFWHELCTVLSKVALLGVDECDANISAVVASLNLESKSSLESKFESPERSPSHIWVESPLSKSESEFKWTKESLSRVLVESPFTESESNPRSTMESQSWVRVRSPLTKSESEIKSMKKDRSQVRDESAFTESESSRLNLSSNCYWWYTCESICRLVNTC